jgi:hypothetical protein
MISKQAHLVVQRIQEEQHLKSSIKEKDKEIDSLHDFVNNLEVKNLTMTCDFPFLILPITCDRLISLVLMSSLSLFLQIDSYHTDVAKKCITPKEISKMMPTESSSQKT